MPPRKWSDLLPLLPPVLLFLVALGQVYLAHTADLTPWKGGGFGMFSTNDGESRWVEVRIDGSQGEREIEIPDYDRTANALAAFPTPGRIRVFGHRIAEAYREPGEQGVRVRVGIWRPDYDSLTMEPRRERIREVVIEIESAERER
jgi:hypothetical protein